MFVLVVGIGMLSTLIYGLSTFPPDTVSYHMKEYPAYRTVLSIQVVLEIVLWSMTLQARWELSHSMVDWGFFAICAMITGWIGLIIFLTDVVHFVLVGVLIVSFLTMILILLYLTTPVLPRMILGTGAVILTILSIVMVSIMKNSIFYIPEYIAFMLYSVIFTLYFTFYPYYKWSSHGEALLQRLHETTFSL